MYVVAAPCPSGLNNRLGAPRISGEDDQSKFPTTSTMTFAVLVI